MHSLGQSQDGRDPSKKRHWKGAKTMGTAHLLEPLLGESFAERRAEAKTIPYSLPPSENKREF